MIPHISDKGRRTIRTVLQVLGAFLTFAAAYPHLVALIGAPTGSRLELWLGVAGGWIAAAAAVITLVMAHPVVDQVLTLLGVGSIPRGQVQVTMKQIEAATAEVGSVLEQEVPVTAPAIEKLEDIEAALADTPEPVATLTAAEATPAAAPQAVPTVPITPAF